MSVTVEKLTQSKKVKDRWYLNLSDGSELKVNVSLIADFGIYSGRELSDEEEENLRRAASQFGAKSRALRIAGARAMSRGELTERLVQKGETPDDAEEAADYLERIGALNDEEYAGMIVRHYSAAGYGEAKIKNELYRRRVPREYWDGALSQMPDSTEKIDAIVASRLRGKTPDKKELKRLTDALMRRGFGWTEIREAVARYGADPEEEDYGI